MSRRDFIEFAALSSTARVTATPLTTQAAAAGKQKARAHEPTYGALSALAAGVVSPDGWLKLYLQKQARQLTGQHPKIAWPFTAPFWSGGESEITHGHDWWGWEQKGYWIDGAVRCALALQDEALLRQALIPIEHTLNHVKPDGYIGPEYLHNPPASHRTLDDCRWPHNVLFRALAAHGEATRDPHVAVALRRHFLTDKSRLASIYAGPSLSITNVEGMLWAYQHTGDRELLAMAEQAWEEYLRICSPGDLSSSDLHPEGVLAGTRIRAHGVTYAEKAKLPAILYLHTGDPEYLRYAIAAQERMFTHHMLIDGLPSSAEEFGGINALDAHETCNISAMSWGWGYLLMATGEGLWGDRIERACFNAGFGAIKKDWKGAQYFSSPNQVIATNNSCHVPYGHDELTPGWMAYRPVPAHEPACCAGNVHRFLPNYVIRMWMHDSAGGLAAVLYGPSRVRAEVGSGYESVEIQQETHYPFEESIHFTIKAARPVAFPLSLRIPRWCKAPRLALNGVPLALPPIRKGFVRIERTFKPGDRITLTLPMRVRVSFWPGTWSFSSVGLEHGPLVYALGVKEDWASSVSPKYSTVEFPDWEATAATPWNYGIAVKEDELAAHAKVERTAVADDPWINPPVRLVVPMKKIPEWTLQTDLKYPDRKLTPSVPGVVYGSKSEVEQVELVPYGSTHLRVSIFPRVYPTI